MNEDYLVKQIEHISSHAKVHDQTFAGRPEHANCLERFQLVIAGLEKELEKLRTHERGAE